MMKFRGVILVFLLLVIFLPGCSGQPPGALPAIQTPVDEKKPVEESPTESDTTLVQTIKENHYSEEVAGGAGITWNLINTFDSTIAFSKIARLGKISVFILSTSWCGPCKTLRENLSKHPELKGEVDFYYIDMSFNHTYSELKKTDAYFYSRMYDRLSEWPRVVITSPTASIVKSFSHEDLVKECQERKLYASFFSDQPSVAPSVEVAALKESLMAGCGDISVYDKTLEILGRLLEHTGKFKIDRVITSFD